MLQISRATAHVSSDVDTSINDLLQAASRLTLLFSGAMYLIWHILATGGWIAVHAGRVWLVSLVMALTYGVALWLLPRRLVVAQIVWLAGLSVATTAALVLFKQPEIAFLYALLPFLAVITLHWRAGLLAEGLIILLLIWVSQDSSLRLSSGYLFAIAGGGLMTWLLGWTSYYTAATVTEWSFRSFTQARQSMEDAQNHRAQLATMVKDLDQAYYRLERSNAALVAARKLAEDAEHFKTEFITNVSHEIRTPLNLIVGFSDVMLTAPESYDVIGRRVQYDL
jgi:signal transduction histidine kinase